MFTRILTEHERKQIRAFIKADGEKTTGLRVLATRCRQNRKLIESDLALIVEFLKHYS